MCVCKNIYDRPEQRKPSLIIVIGAEVQGHLNLAVVYWSLFETKYSYSCIIFITDV